MSWFKNRPRVLAACAVLVAGFVGGWIAAKASEGFHLSSAPGSVFGISFGHARDANAPRAGLPKPEGFAVWRQRVDTAGADPKVCIEFTRPLDAARSYGDFVLVSPDPGKPAAVTVKGAELCLGGLGFYDRRVTFLKGLPAQGGETLKANADVDITFGEKPPFVGFAGEGVILPREDGDGVGIETVNVAKLAIEVWRVPDRNLVRKSISAPDASGEGEWSGDYGDDSPDDDGRVVWKGEVAVHGSGGQRATTVFPLNAVLKELKPGAYVIKARDASAGRGTKIKGAPEGDTPAQARRWILFTDMALVTYRGAEGLDVVVRSLKTARPLSGVKLDLVAKEGETLQEERSDAQGHVRFPKALLNGDGAAAAKMVMAYGPGADFTVLDLDRSPVDLSNQGVGGRQAEGAPALTAGRKAAPVIDSYVYTDRGVYRPGESVHLVALLRDAEARSVKDRKGALVIKRPSGVEAARLTFDKTPDGFATTDYALAKSSARGRWTAELLIDGLDEPAGKATFSVEDFAPQRLAVDLDAKAAAPVGAGEKRQIGVNTRFLYGAPGAGLKVEGEARVKADHDPFPRYKDFQWGDQQAGFEEKQLDLTPTVTDGSGHATLAFDASQAKDTAEPLKALITAQVFEPGGRPVSEGATLSIRPRSVFLGVKVDQPDGGGSERLIGLNVIAVNAQGSRVAVSGVRWSLVSENWTYDWFQENGRWKWRRSSHDVVIANGSLNVGATDPAKLARRLGWGDYRLQLEEPRSKARSVIRFTSGWGTNAESADAPDSVRLSAGTGVHAQGDTIAVTIKAPYAGQVQVAVATDRIVQLKNLSVPEGGTTVRLKSSAAWGGGAYVLVSVIQPRNPVTTPKPRRALGVLYVPLDPKGRKLEVKLGTPDKIRGTEPVLVPVTVKGLHMGQRAKVTIAAVDQGILNLTKFASPDPVKWYFGKRALGVDYLDDYGRLLDPNLGAAAQLNYGADELGGQGLTTTPIKTVALWSGVVSTGLDGTAKIYLPKAAFNGELRIMAVAWTDDAVGSSEKKLTVREPVVAELDLPRFLSPGDHAQATLELHNLEGKPGGYTADVTGQGGLDIGFHKLIQLALGQRITDQVAVNAPARPGVGQVSFRAQGPGFDQTQTYGLETRTGWGAETRVTSELQRPGESFTPGPELLNGFQPGSASLTVSYSPFRGFDPAPIAEALTKYPYGCTEQLVSGAYPWLYLGPGLGGNLKGRAAPLLSQAVGRLLDRQAADGAFGLWKAGDGEASAWLGAYATDFLVEARAHGVPAPDAAVDRALNAMRLISRPDGSPSISYRLDYPKWWWAGAEDATARLRSQASAYALYVMSKVQGHGDLARLRWYHDVQFKTERSPLARAQIGAGLSRMGDQARAHDSFKQAEDALGYKEPGDWYQSPLRDLAAVIALAYESHEEALARRLQARLDGAVKDPDQLNTQEQARLVQAAGAMLQASGALRIDAQGATQRGSPNAPYWRVGRLAAASFVNRGSGPIWRTVTVRGAPASAPGATEHGVSLQKAWFTLQGATIDPGHVAQGTRMVVRLSGRSQQGTTLPLVIDDALPAGFEIETVLSPEDAKSGPYKFLGELHDTGAQESRDDRYIAALDVAGNDGFAVAYIVRAITPGDFYRPGAEARHMYKAGVFARTAGGRTQVGGR